MPANIKKRLSHQDLVDSHGEFFTVACSFMPGALRLTGDITVVGSLNRVPLQILIEWDSHTVWLGYKWNLGMGHREQTGLESSISASEVVKAALGENWQHSPYLNLTVKDVHDLILAAVRRCQSTLDNVGVEEGSDAIRLKTFEALGLEIGFSPIHNYSCQLVPAAS